MALTVAAIDTAISAIETGGQSFTLDGMTYTAGSLEALRKLRETVKSEVSRQDGTRPYFRAFKLSGAGY